MSPARSRARYATGPQGGLGSDGERFCLLLPTEPSRTELEERFFRALIAAKGRSEVPCALRVDPASSGP